MQLNRPPSVGNLQPPICLGPPLVLPFVGPYHFDALQKGLTILELMTVLVIAGILLGFAVPGISSFIQDSRIVGQTNDLIADFSFARSEAIKRRTNVIVCKAANPTDASAACSTTTTWDQGRIIFADNNGDSALTAGEPVLRVREALAGNNVTLKAGANLINRLVFLNTGITTLGTPADANDPKENRFILCHQGNANKGRSVTLEVTGRPTIAKKPTTCDPV